MNQQLKHLRATCHAALIACLACSLAMRNSEAAESKSEKETLFVLREHLGPVIGPDHPDVKASGNRSGFETGQVVKHKGVYHMFVNEMFGQHHIENPVVSRLPDGRYLAIFDSFGPREVGYSISRDGLDNSF